MWYVVVPLVSSERSRLIRRPTTALSFFEGHCGPGEVVSEGAYAILIVKGVLFFTVDHLDICETHHWAAHALE